MSQVVDDIDVTSARDIDLSRRRQDFQNVDILDALTTIYIPQGTYFLIFVQFF
jgi:hypothetical protein